MKLREFRVTNFRSVVDSGIIKVSDITSFIGANESGKSSILQGLHSISLDSSYDFFDLTQLQGIQKRVNDLEITPSDIPIIWCKWELNDEEQDILKETLKDKKTKYFEISKHFDECYVIQNEEKLIIIPSRQLLREKEKLISNRITNIKRKVNDFRDQNPFQGIQAEFDNACREAEKYSNQNYKRIATRNCFASLEAFSNNEFQEELKLHMKSNVQKIMQIIDHFYLQDGLPYGMFNFLVNYMPRTVYFKTYERLEDNVSLSELKSNPQLHKTFTNFLKLAEIKIETVERLKDETIRQVYIESACGKATKQLRDAWHQEDLDVELRLSNDRFMVFTKNSKAVETLLPPSLGSEGFQWFLGFYINFGAETNAEYKRAILLLDDPGVFLHPSGHKDLLSLFEEYLKNEVTTIYSTHLPFLINRDKLDRIRLVYKEEEGRTNVTEKFYTVDDKDLLYPIRANLGVTLADSLLIGEKTIIAEGYSDRIILKGMMEEIHNKEIRKINYDNIEIISGMGAKGCKEYALLLWMQNLPFVMVLDNDEEGRNAKKQIIKDGINKNNIININIENSKMDNYDIEDLFDISTYSEAFYNVHGTYLDVNKTELLEIFKEGDKKINNKAKRILKDLKYEIDKIQIAYELIKVIKSKKKLKKIEQDNFLQLMDEINNVMNIYLSTDM